MADLLDLLLCVETAEIPPMDETPLPPPETLPPQDRDYEKPPISAEEAKDFWDHAVLGYKESERKKLNDKIAHRVTFASITVAVIAATAAVWSGYEARHARIEASLSADRSYRLQQYAFESDHRPFVAVEPRKIADSAGILASLTNFGRSPALRWSARCFVPVG
jgi:hypothetical protein